MSRSLFIRKGEQFMPTALAGSPWHQQVLHGGAPAGLFARCLESKLEQGWVPSRLSIDLLRPVPRQALQVTLTPVRVGKRIRIWEAQMSAAGELVARADALLVKAAMEPLPLPDYAPRHQRPFSGPLQYEEKDFRDILFSNAMNTPDGLHTTVQLRPVSELCEQGRGTAWITCPIPLLEGEQDTPFVRAALVSDFGNGVGQLSLSEGQGTINADVQLFLSRLPRGEWLALQSEALLEISGIGQVNSVLYDRDGRVGQVVQTIMPMTGYRN